MPSVGGLLLGGDRLVVDRLALLAQEAGQPRALLLGDVRAVQADEPRRRRRQEQHVALAEQLLGAVAVENRARVDLRRHAERDARRQVRLDEAGDDVDRRPLRRENQVDADGARHLRQARDRFLDLVAGHHHQVGELVDDDDDEGQRLAASRRPAACASRRSPAGCCGCTARCCARRRPPASCSALPSRAPPSAARWRPASDRRRPASSGAGCPRTSRARAASDRS